MGGFTNVFVKFILFSFNFLLSIAGLAIAGFGAYWLFQGKNWNDITNGNFNAVFIAIVVAGSFMFLVSSLGCCGAAKGNSFMLLTYTLILVILLVAQVVLASFLLAKRDDTVGFIVKKVETVFKKSRDELVSQRLRDIIETTFSCCSLEDQDFNYDQDLPKSCCAWRDREKPCRKGAVANETLGTLNENGCHRTIQKWLTEQVKYVAIALFSLSLVQLIAVTFSCYLSKST